MLTWSKSIYICRVSRGTWAALPLLVSRLPGGLGWRGWALWGASFRVGRGAVLALVPWWILDGVAPLFLGEDCGVALSGVRLGVGVGAVLWSARGGSRGVRFCRCGPSGGRGGRRRRGGLGVVGRSVKHRQGMKTTYKMDILLTWDVLPSAVNGRTAGESDPRPQA